MRALNALRSIVPRFGRGGASKPTAEAAEMSFYDAVKSKASALNKISYHRNHYLYGVSSLIKNEGIRIAPDAMDNSVSSTPVVAHAV